MTEKKKVTGATAKPDRFTKEELLTIHKRAIGEAAPMPTCPTRKNLLKIAAGASTLARTRS